MLWSYGFLQKIKNITTPFLNLMNFSEKKECLPLKTSPFKEELKLSVIHI